MICSANNCSEPADPESANKWPLCTPHLAEARELLAAAQDDEGTTSDA